jgi:N-acetylglutamate synthase-like GNAT family acetyltransferase
MDIGVKLKHPESAMRFKISDQTDINGIMKFINKEYERSGAVLPVSRDDVAGWVNSGNSIIAVNGDGVVKAHQAVSLWPISGVFEFRSAVVAPESRRQGINYWMKRLIIEELVHRSEDSIIQIISLKNGKSGGSGTLRALGFKVIQEHEIPKEMLSIGGEQEWKAYKLIKECRR